MALIKRKNVAKVPKVPVNFGKTKLDPSDRILEDIEVEAEKIHHTMRGPTHDNDGVPYNYIVVVDAGSKGSRAYVYNYLDTGYMVEHGLLHNVTNDEASSQVATRKTTESKSGPHLVRRLSEESALPVLSTGRKWHKKIRPGLSSFEDQAAEHDVDELTQIMGPKYLHKLLKRVNKVVPEELQSTTPIYVHATAGMRLLDEPEQKRILGATCNYIQTHSKLYLPDCDTHVRVIDGDEEGLYGWIALNYLAGTLHNGAETHGLLEMGGASTQVVFEPTKKERSEYNQKLLTLRLATKGSIEPDMEYQLFSTSFLGYGMSKMRESYVLELAKTQTDATVLQDPCMPKNLKESLVIGETTYKLEGLGDFDNCNDGVYKIFAEQSNCQNIREKVSKCMVDDEIPPLDVDLNKFYGVSGYWDTIATLLDLGDAEEAYGKMYSYKEIAKETKKVCSLDWKKLTKYKDADNDDLSQLCFKSSYLLNVLHNGLGLEKKKSTNFQVNDQINGSDFTWTLGRAVLYASDDGLRQTQLLKGNSTDGGVGYYRESDPSTFFRGAEPRPAGHSYYEMMTHIPYNPSVLGIMLSFILICIMAWKRAPVLRTVEKIHSKVSTKLKRYQHHDVETGLPLDDLTIEIDDDEPEDQPPTPK